MAPPRHVTSTSSADEFVIRLHELERTVLNRIWHATNADSAIAAVIGAIGEELGWPFGEAWLPQASAARSLRLGATWVAAEPYQALIGGHPRVIRFGESLAGRAWQSAAPVVVEISADQPAGESTRFRIARELGLTHAAAVPLIFEERLIAILLYFSTAFKDLNPVVALLSTSFASVGAAIERKQIEAQLTTSARQHAAIARLGRFALAAEHLDQVFTEAVQLAARTLEVERCAILEIDPADGAFVARGGIGWSDDMLSLALDNAAVPLSHLAEAPHLVQSGDLGVWPPVSSSVRVSTSSGPVSAMSAPIRGPRGAFGCIIVIGADTESFERTDLHFLQAMANLLTTALYRRHIEETRSQVAAIVESSEDAIIGNSLDGVITSWNRGARHMLGYSEQEAFGRTLASLASEDRVQQTREFIEAVKQDPDGDHRIETVWNARFGRAIDVSVRGSSFRNASGEVIGVSAIARDITDQMRTERELKEYRERLEALVEKRTAELQESHERLRAVERLASIGTLAAGLGHDMNNLLFSLRCRLDSADSIVTTGPARDDLCAIRDSLHYLQKLSDGLRLLAADPRVPRDRDRVPNLVSWWDEVYPCMVRTLPRDAALDVDIPDRLPPIAVGPHRLTQAIFNILVNAGEAIAEHGSVSIRARTTQDGSHVCLSVSDDGLGMSADVRRRALDPFFTTKTRGLSTGLGLSIAHGVVQSTGGSMEIESTPNSGTTVSLEFPVCTDEEDGVGKLPRLALLRIRDPRTGAALRSILRSLNFTISEGKTSNMEPGSKPSLVIIEETEPGVHSEGAQDWAGWSRAGRIVVLIRDGDQPPPPGVLIAERRDGLQGIRHAVRQAVERLQGSEV